MKLDLSYGWELQEDICFCDVHFNEYLNRNDIKNKVIFHFGTGKHHIIGKENIKNKEPNKIMGITYTPGEYISYMGLVKDNPLIGNYYKVMFVDAYNLSPELLPDFDIITLFHLCEFSRFRNKYAHFDDYSLLDMFLTKLKKGGNIIFYNGSSHYLKKPDSDVYTSLVLDKFVKEGKIKKIDEFRSLLIYSKV